VQHVGEAESFDAMLDAYRATLGTFKKKPVNVSLDRKV
jgi:hypothetical protein